MSNIRVTPHNHQPPPPPDRINTTSTSAQTMQPTAVLHRSIRRLALTTKQVNGGYYKGTRTGSMGRHTKYGGYMIDLEKVRTYVVPDLTGFKLTPFVTRKMERTWGAKRYREASPLSGKLYLQRWKNENGED